jgi:hypothetical protein
MNIGRILPGIAILSGRIFVCGGEVDSQILANGEVSTFLFLASLYR